ncbi:MAG: GGDEF domain-containing protein [Acidimicrobiales bacterium]
MSWRDVAAALACTDQPSVIAGPFGVVRWSHRSIPEDLLTPGRPPEWLARVVHDAGPEPTDVPLSLPLPSGGVSGTARVRRLSDGHVVVVLGGSASVSIGTDPLTGLADRRAVHGALDRALQVPGRRIAVLFIDLDGFKAVNDTYGHEAGDDLLIEVARRLTHELRHADVVARFGGDEFVAVLEGVDDLGVAAVAERVCEAVQRSVAVAGGTVQVSASVGIAVGTGGVVSPRSLLHQADLAMYTAKARGRGRVARYHPSMSRIAPRHGRPAGRQPVA